MNLADFKSLKWSNSKAYILGLVFPRIDFANIENHNIGNLVIAGTVAHQPGTVSDAEILEHIFSINEMLMKDDLSKDFSAYFSNDVRYMMPSGSFRRNGKKGFILGIETEYKLEEILDYQSIYDSVKNELIAVASEIPDEYLDAYVAGTIDGRSSYDTAYRFVSLDIDRDEDKHTAIEKLIERSGINASINRRGGRTDSAKADQLRYKPTELEKILGIGILSHKRYFDIKRGEGL